MPSPQTTFTQAELRDRVRGDVGLRGNNLVQDGDIDDWAQRIIRESAHLTQWYQTTDTFDSVSGTADYDLPTSVIALKAVYFNDLPLEEITFNDLAEGDAYWRLNSNGTPYCWYRRGMTGYTLFPTPDESTTDAIRLYFSKIPDMPSGDSDTYDFPPQNEGLLIAYCSYRASLKDASGEGRARVDIYLKEYMAELERLKEAYADLGEGEVFVVGINSGRGAWRDRWTRQLAPDPYI